MPAYYPESKELHENRTNTEGEIELVATQAR
jgi:hypothetical protein